MYKKRSNDLYILCKRFKKNAICRNYGNSDVAGFTGIDIAHKAAFTFVCAANYFALGAVFLVSCSCRLFFSSAISTKYRRADHN